MKHVHVIVTGRVQGVAYRAWTEGEALLLGLSGWVRNRQNGSVEAELAGPESAVDTMLTRMRNGPPPARVDDLRVDEAAGAVPEGFEIRG